MIEPLFLAVSLMADFMSLSHGIVVGCLRQPRECDIGENEDNTSITDIRSCYTPGHVCPLNVLLCLDYEFSCIVCDLKFVLSGSLLESGTAKQGRFPWE